MSTTLERSDSAHVHHLAARPARSAKPPTTAPRPDPIDLDEVVARLRNVNVVNLCEHNPMRNVGDHWSAVVRSVRWVEALGAPVSIDEVTALETLPGRSPLQGKLVIVGGSGLVGPNRFEAAVESAIRQRPAAIAIWGIGHNAQDGILRDPTTGWRRRTLRDGVTLLWPEWLTRAHLVGVRDWDVSMPWVPCASSMLTAFDELRTRPVRHDFVVLNHYEHPIDVQPALAAGLKFDHLTNNTEDIELVLERLAAAKVVVTNSYHAIYWGLLLGKAVVNVAPNSTRFRHFRWPVTQAPADDWLPALEVATASPNALAEAREANVAFSRQVLALGQNLGLIGRAVDLDPARGSDSWRSSADVRP